MMVVYEAHQMQVKLDYGIPGSASSQGVPELERILVVCSTAAGDALLQAAGLFAARTVSMADASAEDAADAPLVTCVEISGDCSTAA